jgi:hypothetical protein
MHGPVSDSVTSRGAATDGIDYPAKRNAVPVVALAFCEHLSGQLRRRDNFNTKQRGLVGDIPIHTGMKTSQHDEIGHRNFAADPHSQFEFDQSLTKYVFGEARQPPVHFRMLSGS